MKRLTLLTLAILASATIASAQTQAEAKSTKFDSTTPAKVVIKNPAIDMTGYLAVAAEAAHPGHPSWMKPRTDQNQPQNVGPGFVRMKPLMIGSPV